MFNKNWYDNLITPVGGEFGYYRDELLKSYYHSGIDYLGNKNIKIKPTINGLLHNIFEHKSYGKVVTLMHNPKFIFGIDDFFYIDYCHIDNIDKSLKLIFNEIVGNIKKFYLVKNNDILGNMGNSGYCLTYDKVLKKWRKVTIEEKNNKNYNGGVHTHISIYQNVKNNEKTKMFVEMVKMGIISELNIYKDYFWQWNKLFYNPNKIYEYFILLQKK